MEKLIVPVNFLEATGISKEQYARMGGGEVLELVRLYYEWLFNQANKSN